MSITVEICWEIFSNPNDLYIYINHKDNLDGFVIGRGVQGHYKALVTFDPVLGSQQSAVELINTYLLNALQQSKKVQVANQVLPGVDSLTASFPLLDQELIEKIQKDLKNNGEVNTHTFFITSPH
jgi:hypothetical protein